MSKVIPLSPSTEGDEQLSRNRVFWSKVILLCGATLITLGGSYLGHYGLVPREPCRWSERDGRVEWKHKGPYDMYPAISPPRCEDCPPIFHHHGPRPHASPIDAAPVQIPPPRRIEGNTWRSNRRHYRSRGRLVHFEVEVVALHPDTPDFSGNRELPHEATRGATLSRPREHGIPALGAPVERHRNVEVMPAIAVDPIQQDGGARSSIRIEEARYFHPRWSSVPEEEQMHIMPFSGPETGEAVGAPEVMDLPSWIDENGVVTPPPQTGRDGSPPEPEVHYQRGFVGAPAVRCPMTPAYISSPEGILSRIAAGLALFTGVLAILLSFATHSRAENALLTGLTLFIAPLALMQVPTVITGYLEGSENIRVIALMGLGYLAMTNVLGYALLAIMGSNADLNEESADNESAVVKEVPVVAVAIVDK